MPITSSQADQLQLLTVKKLQKMYDDKKQSPSLFIPKTLPSFTKSPIFIKFLQSVFQYCFNFNQTLKSYSSISTKMKQRLQVEVSLLQKEKQVLGNLEKQSYNYASIILKVNRQYMESEKNRNNFKDQIFFQALIYLVQRIMKEMFTREEFIKIQEQINRLFRTNRYNLIRKRHENDELLKKFPALKQQKYKNKNNLANILKKAFQRTNAFRRYQKQRRSYSSHNYTSILEIAKQFPNPDMNQRSPLLCTWLPSRKSMLTDFNTLSSYSNHLQSCKRKSTMKFFPPRGASSKMTSLGTYETTHSQF